MHRDTLIVHAGYRKRTEAGPFLSGPQFSSTFTSPGEPSQHALTYGRFHNPTWTAWEEAVGTLEGGHAVTFASGMAAVSAVLGGTLRPGDVLVLPEDCYYTVRRLAAGWLKSIGVDVRLAPTRDNGQAAVIEGATLLWLETPSNPTLDICDIGALSQAARAGGTLVVVDNTTATPYLQQPLALGADIVVHSTTKYVGGHSDSVGGAVLVNDDELASRLHFIQNSMGAVPGPFDCFLTLRGAKTLAVRMERHCDNATAIASTLRRLDRSAKAAIGIPIVE